MKEGQGVAILFYGLWKLCVWTWKAASFTGAWVLLVPMVIGSFTGGTVLTTILLIASLLFCVGWTGKNLAHTSAVSSRRELTAPTPSQSAGSGFFFGREE